jgi:hypothetical protein
MTCMGTRAPWHTTSQALLIWLLPRMQSVCPCYSDLNPITFLGIALRDRKAYERETHASSRYQHWESSLAALQESLDLLPGR